jgi:hypothetical protein
MSVHFQERALDTMPGCWQTERESGRKLVIAKGITRNDGFNAKLLEYRNEPDK